MTPQTIQVPIAFPWPALVSGIAASVLACFSIRGRPDMFWLALGIMLGVWTVFLVIARRAPLTLDAEGLLLHRHRIGWDEITSIEPPSVRGEIVLRLRRAVPDRFRLAREGSQDWLLLEGTGFAAGPLALYALLVGASREASWLLSSADDD